MAHKIIWSQKAADNLANACDRIAQFSQSRARAFAAGIISEIEKLETFPQLGRIVPEYNDAQTREIIRDDYRIIYRCENDSVKIGQIRHGAMLLDTQHPF